MKTGILYSAFVCFIVGLAGTGVFWSLRKRRKKGEGPKYNQSLDYFSLLLGLIWIFIGLGNIFSWLKHPEVHALLYEWVIGPLTYIHLLPAFYYFGWSFFGKKKTVRFSFNLLFSLLAGLTAFTHFKYGFTSLGTTYWGSKHKLNAITRNLFVFGLFIPGFLIASLELIRRSRKWFASRQNQERQLAGFALGFFVYAITGFFEALVFTEGWLILLGRIGIMFGPLIFYFFATLEERD